MLFHSSIRRELARTFIATLVVLVTVMVTLLLVRTLGLAVRGRVNPSEVMLVIGYTVLTQLATLLALSMFVAIVASLTRMYRDSEMAIWFASGRGLANFMSPVFRFAAPILVLVGLLSLVAWPWANLQLQNIRSQYEQRNDVDRIAPGQFQESGGGNRVFFIDRAQVDTTSASNVFIAERTANGASTVTSAHSARLETHNGERTVVLLNGQRLEYDLPSDEVRLTEFKEYGVRIGDARAVKPSQDAKTLSSFELLQSPDRINLAELGWRVGLLLAAINFTLMGLALTAGNPRAAQSGNLAFTVFAAVAYYNLMNIAQSWAGSGRLSAVAGLLLLHGTVTLAALLVLWRRNSNARLLDWMFARKAV